MRAHVVTCTARLSAHRHCHSVLVNSSQPCPVLKALHQQFLAKQSLLETIPLPVILILAHVVSALLRLLYETHFLQTFVHVHFMALLPVSWKPSILIMLFSTLLGPSDCQRLRFNVLSIDYVRVTNCFYDYDYVITHSHHWNVSAHGLQPMAYIPTWWNILILSCSPGYICILLSHHQKCWTGWNWVTWLAL